MYTYRLRREFGLVKRIDIYFNGEFTYMAKEGMWPVEEARRIAKQDVDLLNKDYAKCISDSERFLS